MAKCDRCRTTRHDLLYSFGGAKVCERCYDDVNPKLITYKLMHPSSVIHTENRLIELRKQVRDFEHMLEINNELIKKGVTTLTKRILR